MSVEPTESAADFDTTVSEDRLYVVKHVIFKMEQFNGLAVPAVYPLVRLALRRRPLLPLSGVAWATVHGVFLFGPVIGAVLGFGRLYNQPDYAIQDRAYRLRHNPYQNRVDSLWHMGLVGGAAASFAVPAARLVGPWWVRAAFGAVIGADLGILAHLATIPDEKDIKRI